MEQSGIHALVEEIKDRFEKESLHPWLEKRGNLERILNFVAVQTFDEFRKVLDKERIPYAMDAVSHVMEKYLPLVNQVKQERRIYRIKRNKIAILTGLGAGTVFLSGLAIDSYFRFGHLPWLDIKYLDLLLLWTAAIGGTIAFFVKVYYDLKGGTFRHFIDDVPEKVRNNYLEIRDRIFSEIRKAYYQSCD